MRVKLWGVRGSLPSPVSPDRLRWRIERLLVQYERLRESNSSITAAEFLSSLPDHSVSGYGGNTSCAEIQMGKSRLLIDAGSGLRNFSDHVVQTDPGATDYHIYFTHFHWDHLIGLPFFVPLYTKGKTVHFYSVDAELENSLRTLFRKPNFPVPYESVQAQIKIHRIEPRQPFKVGELTCTPYGLDHPDPCWGLRIEAGGKAIAWCVDNEGTRTSRADLGEDLKLYQKADLMVYDAQYTFGEALERINWGHSSGPIGLDLALREEIKQTLFVHHDPAATDETIRHAEDQTRYYYEEILRARRRSGQPIPDLRWRFAFEGEVVEL